MTNAPKIETLRRQVAQLREIEARDVDGTAILAAIDRHGWDAEEIATAKIDRAIERNAETIEILLG